jgi:pilus assembly protein Flp/PilA
MKALKVVGRVLGMAIFAITDPIVIPARAIGMFNPKHKGATAIEYGLIAAGISLAIIAVINTLGSSLDSRSKVSPPTQQAR